MQRIAEAVLNRGKGRIEAAAEAGVSNTVVERLRPSLEAAGDEIVGAVISSALQISLLRTAHSRANRIGSSPRYLVQRDPVLGVAAPSAQ